MNEPAGQSVRSSSNPCEVRSPDMALGLTNAPVKRGPTSLASTGDASQKQTSKFIEAEKVESSEAPETEKLHF